MLSAFIIIFGISLLVLIHELGHFLAAKQAGLLVEEFGFGFPPRMFSIQKGGTRYSFNWLPFGGFVKIYGEKREMVEFERPDALGDRGSDLASERRSSFAHQSIWRRFVIIGAGISINFIFGWLLLSAIFMIGSPAKVLITAVESGGPAEAAGIAAGDELVGFTSTEAFIQQIDQQRGKIALVDISRDGVQETKQVFARPDNSKGALGVIISDVGFTKQPFFRALHTGLEAALFGMAQIFQAMGELFKDLFTRGQVSENVIGPVGIFGVASQLGSVGLLYLLQLIAMISLNLAVLNFIPFPALDGGKILFLIIEKIKGSPVHYRKEVWANVISFGFLVILMLVITGRDIVRLF